MSNDSKSKELLAISVGIFIFLWVLTNYILSFFVTIIVAFFLKNLFKKKPELKEQWKWISVGLIALAVVVPLIRATNNDAQSLQEKEEIVSGQSGTYAYITPVDSYERQVETTIISELGQDTNINNIEIIGGALNIEYVAKNNLTTRLVRQGILSDVESVTERLVATIPENIMVIKFKIMSDLVDQYGNSSLSQVAVISFRQEVWIKINWDNFLTDNIQNVAEEFWIHPALEK